MLRDSDGMNTTEQQEEWRDCPSYPGYKASSLGRIMSPLGRVLRGGVCNLGYRKIVVHGAGQSTFWGNAPGRKGTRAHVLVADAFHGPRPAGMECHHIDHEKLNNVPSNLAYVTHKQNIIEARKAGRFPDMTGERSPMYGRKVSEETRAKMRECKLGARHWRAVSFSAADVLARYAAGETQATICAALGCGRTVVGQVIRGTHWTLRDAVVRQ